MPYIEVKEEISRIIGRCHFHEESLLTDSKKAADNIVEYLQKEDLLSKGKVVKLSDMVFKESVNY